ncbi:MAG: TraM recognition domain-containing protein [bacterium]|nr:TraM recognition domain-containing protein [bacterium]
MDPTQDNNRFELPKFSSPEEELKYLRERVTEKEQKLWQEQQPADKEQIISGEVIAYSKAAPQEVLEEHLLLENPQYEAAVAHIGSLPHREKMRELYRILAERGILNALKIVEGQNNQHIEADFHRVLVEYIKTGGVLPGLEKERELSQLLHMTVFEVTLPFSGSQEGARETSFKEVILSMERFFIGMLPPEGARKENYGPISLELVLSNFSNDIVFYVAVREHMTDLFVKQLLGAFPSAKIEICHADYNIFNEFGASVASYAIPMTNFVYPLQVSDETEGDPITTVLNSFTKIERNGEGAAIQIIFYPDYERIAGKIKYAEDRIRQGVPLKKAIDIPLSIGGMMVKSLGELFTAKAKKEKSQQDLDREKVERDQGEKAITLMDEKLKSPLLRADLRVVVSAATRERADAIRTSIEASLNQFNRPQGGGLKFIRAEKGKLQEVIHDFTFRENNDSDVLILNTKELATLYHFPSAVSQKDAPQLKTVKASDAPAPSDLPSDGTLLGQNVYRGESRDIRLTKADRLRHLYVIGQTGTGKSVFLKNLIIQDILAGNGVCFIDPHGVDVQDVLAAIPKERIEDVIYFDPTYMARPFALNMLEYDITKPEQKIFVVNEMLSIFRKLYEAIPESMGPAFEQYFRYSTLLVMEDPETGNTLLEIPRVMADPAFRNLKLSRCKNPIVVQFWRDIATKTSGDSGLANMIPYITNKFDIFLNNDVMRPIIAQEKSSFNFREIMDGKKILLVNLAKGKLGEINANLLGLVLVGKFLMAAMSRVDSFGKEKLPDFYLYIDEFQNITTDSISAILSEARKYGLSLNVAHQFIAQLDEDIKKSVFGNVGSMVVFRVGTEDAEFLEPQFAPIFKASDIMKIENYNAYVKMLMNGKPVSPFNLQVPPPHKGHTEIVEQLKNLSYLKYGRDRKLVDDAIMSRYLSMSPTKPVEAPRAQTLPRAPAPPLPPSVVFQPATQLAQAPLPAQILLGQQSQSSVAPPQLVPPPPSISPPQNLGGQAPVTTPSPVVAAVSLDISADNRLKFEARTTTRADGTVFHVGDWVKFKPRTDGVDMPSYPFQVLDFSPFGDRVVTQRTKKGNSGVGLDEIEHALPPGQAAAQSPSGAQKPKKVTEEARELVAKTDAGGVPLYYTEGFKRILAENNIPYNDDMTPTGGIERIREKITREDRALASPGKDPVPQEDLSARTEKNVQEELTGESPNTVTAKPWSKVHAAAPLPELSSLEPTMLPFQTHPVDFPPILARPKSDVGGDERPNILPPLDFGADSQTTPALLLRPMPETKTPVAHPPVRVAAPASAGVTPQVTEPAPAPRPDPYREPI